MTPADSTVGVRLRQARIAAGLTQREVVGLLGDRGIALTKAGLSKYERCGSIPKPRILRALAQALKVDTTYLLEEQEVSIRWLAFRKYSRLGKKRQERIKILALMQVATLHALRCALEPHRKPKPVVKTKVALTADAEAAAQRVRDGWDLGSGPIKSVAAAIEDAGGFVVESGDDQAHFDGLSGWLSDQTPVVVTSSSSSDDRRRFSLAHEIGHLAMEVNNIESAAEERLAHRFAAALLVPAETARRELGERRRRLDFQELAALKQKHGLSMQAWIMRAVDLEIIDRSHASALFATMSAQGWRKEEPATFDGHERLLQLRQLTGRALAEGLIETRKAERLWPGISDEFDGGRARTEGGLGIRQLLGLPQSQRDQIMEEAASRLWIDYEEGGPLSGFDCLAEEDYFDVSIPED